MAKIYFIGGFIGSGKTTYSTALAQKAPAFRFSHDEWMLPLYGEHMERDLFDERSDTLDSLFKKSALQLISIGTSVIFDYGFWSQQDRLDAINWAKDNDLDFEFHVLNTPYEVCCERAKRRNEGRDKDATFEMTAEMLDLFWARYEVPKGEELNFIKLVE